MANPTSCGLGASDYVPAVVATDNSEVAVTLDSDKEYTVWHSGFDATGAGSADTSTVYCTFNTTASGAATTAPGDNKAILISGQEFRIGPGITEISTLTAAASNEPVLTIVPHASLHGKF